MTVTVTPTVQLSTTPPSVSLAVSTTTETSTTILRNNADGTQSTVRTSDGNPLATPGHAGTLVDYEPWYGSASSYTSIESPATVSTAVTVAATSVWLTHPGVPSLSVPVRMRSGSLIGNSYALPRGVFHPLGRATAVVVSSGMRQAASGSFTVLTTTQTDLLNLNAILSTGSPLLLNIPATRGWTFSTCYVAVGDVKQQPAAGSLVNEWWMDTVCPFDVVDSPAGGSAAQRSYTDLLAFASYTQVQAAYASYTALLTGP